MTTEKAVDAPVRTFTADQLLAAGLTSAQQKRLGLNGEKPPSDRARARNAKLSAQMTAKHAQRRAEREELERLRALAAAPPTPAPAPPPAPAPAPAPPTLKRQPKQRPPPPPTSGARGLAAPAEDEEEDESSDGYVQKKAKKARSAIKQLTLVQEQLAMLQGSRHPSANPFFGLV